MGTVHHCQMDEELEDSGGYTHSVAEVQGYRRVIQTLDYEQHLNLSAHLYSAFLIKRDQPIDGPKNSDKKVMAGRVPHKYWTAWPVENAPPPPFIDDHVPDLAPELVSRAEVQNRAAEGRAFKYPSLPVGQTPEEILLNSCDSYLQRLVYDRIFKEQRTEGKIVPSVDHEPKIDDIWPQTLLKVLDKYLDLPGPGEHSAKASPGSIGYQQLSITGPAETRIQSLFENLDPADREHKIEKRKPGEMN